MFFQVQKEKLHAELKQVLSKKRNQLNERQSRIASMDPSEEKSKSMVCKIQRELVHD